MSNGKLVDMSCKLNVFFRDKLFDHIIFKFIVVLFISLIVTSINSKDINLSVAYHGMGPQDYVNQKIYPDNFKNDFLPGQRAEHYDRSLVMITFYWVKKYLDVDPSLYIYIFMFGQTFFFIFSIFAIFESFKIKWHKVAFIAIPFLITQRVAGADLARFSLGWGIFLKIPLFYGWSSGFVIMAVSYFLRNRYLMMCLMLTGAITSHITIGLFGSLFIFSYCIFSFKEFLRKDFLLPVLLLALVICLYIFVVIGVSERSLGTGVINFSHWLKMTKMFGHHWYPLTMKLFTQKINDFIYFLFSIALMLLSFGHSFHSDKKKVLKLLAGIFISIAMIPIGVLFSDIYPVPFVIKLCFQRASSFASFFSIVIYLIYILRSISKNEHPISFLLSVLALGVIFFKNIGFYNYFILLSIELIRLIFFVSRKSLNLKFYKLDMSYFYKSRSFIVLFWAVICLVSWRSTVAALTKASAKSFDREKAKSYMEAQIWASKNTDHLALFAVDPGHSYAWRDFSARSSFGTFRDWGYVGIAYKANIKKYNEGKRRAKIFGVDFDSITIKEINDGVGPISGKYKKIASQNYYKMNTSDLMKLSSDEGINYFVFERSRVKNNFSMSKHIKFSNENYIILSFN